MKFKKWMDQVEAIGKMAVFYIPSSKAKSHQENVHQFLIKNFGAYTHEQSDIKGYWKKGKQIIRDKNERYEVSFEGKDRISVLVDFLSKLCKKMKEEAIYLTMGDRSYLVKSE
jgi:hypothetical protein